MSDGPRPDDVVSVGEARVRIERAVVEIFARRLGAQLVPYGLARVLVGLEAELANELGKLSTK